MFGCAMILYPRETMASCKTSLQTVEATTKRRGVRMVPVDVVEPERVVGDIGLAGCLRVVPLMRENVDHRRISGGNSEV